MPGHRLPGSAAAVLARTLQRGRRDTPAGREGACGHAAASASPTPASGKRTPSKPFRGHARPPQDLSEPPAADPGLGKEACVSCDNGTPSRGLPVCEYTEISAKTALKIRRIQKIICRYQTPPQTSPVLKWYLKVAKDSPYFRISLLLRVSQNIMVNTLFLPEVRAIFKKTTTKRNVIVKINIRIWVS